MIIAILLCMAFVVNVGTTLATSPYELNATSINAIIEEKVNTNTFMDFASVQGSSGMYEYNPGVVNNQLGITYGFDTANRYDLMIRFTAVYTDTENNNGSNTHLANDFTLNIANRDDWCIDMGVVGGWTNSNGSLIQDISRNYYVTGSTSSTLTGVMYYMDTLTGSGTLPVISGVTFHTSPNDSYVFLGDKLTITLTPEYAISDGGKYNASHPFSAFGISAEAYNNWTYYMDSISNSRSLSSTKVMIYNAYVDSARTLEYPYDPSVMKDVTITEGETQVTNKQVNTELTAQPNYANTAYRYKVTETARNYDTMTAGNRYNGGLGIYVIPQSDLLTISVSFSYNWYNWQNNSLAGSVSSKMVRYEYTNEFQKITTAQGPYYYYKGTIGGVNGEPIYIDVLDYLQITSEDYEIIVSGGYCLLLSDVSVGLVTSTDPVKTDVGGNDWTGEYARENYKINNSTKTSPILVRVKDIVGIEQFYDTDISVTNNSSTPMQINGFTISSKLWYGFYADSESDFIETAMAGGYLPSGAVFEYDTNLWQVSSGAGGVFNFTLKSGSIYIPSGYTLTLINGVEIPKITACQSGDVANDFWCTFEATVNQSSTVNYTETARSSVETIIDGYYAKINATRYGKIYIRNNSLQEITKVTITNLKVYALDESLGMMSRHNAVPTYASYQIEPHLDGNNISIKPGEMVLAYTIKPTEDAVIYDFDISTTLKTYQDEESKYVEENNDIDLLYNEAQNEGVLVNNSDKYYEFRLVSDTQLSLHQDSSSQFIAKTVTANEVTTYYYYYKGIICPNRCIKILAGFSKNVTVDYIEHDSSKNGEQYTANNYKDWGFVEADELDNASWLSAMKKLFAEPTTDERKQAIVVS